jgi:hypothetical protein
MPHASGQVDMRRKGIMVNNIADFLDDDYLDLAGLLALDVDERTAKRLLAASHLTGNDGRAVIEAGRLGDFLEMEGWR